MCRTFISRYFVGVLLVGQTSFGLAGGPLGFDDPYQRILSFDYGKDRLGFLAIEEEIRQATAAQKETIEAKLLDALKSPRATPACRRVVCRLLPQVGTCRSVPVLAELLINQETAAAALYGLQGLVCVQTDQVLRESLGRVEGVVKIGIVQALGARGDREAVPVLAPLLASPDHGLVQAALVALGRIGGGESARVLLQTQIPADLESLRAGAYLRCGDTLLAAGDPAKAAAVYREMFRENRPLAVRVAAFRGLVLAEGEAAISSVVSVLKQGNLELQRAAAMVTQELPGVALTQAVAAELPSFPAGAQVLALQALAIRGDRRALPVVEKLAASEDQEVRVAALQALGALGRASSVDLLLGAVQAGGASAQAALQSLGRLRGEGVESALLRRQNDDDPVIRSAVINSLGARYYRAAVPWLLTSTRDQTGAVRQEAWKALGTLAEPGQLPEMIDLMLKAESGREQWQAEQAVQSTSNRITDVESRAEPLLTVLAQTRGEARSCLLRVLGRLGGASALAAIRTSLKDPEVQVQDEAVRSLAGADDFSVLPDLLDLAEQAPSPTHRIVALRGYVRLTGADLKRSPEEKIKMFRRAMALAKRVEEQKLVLSGLAGIRASAALKAVQPYLTDRNLRPEAEGAYTRIALSIARIEPAVAKAALKRVLKSTSDARLREEAQEGLESLGQR